MRRVRATLAVLVTVTVVAVGTVGRALAWPASPAAGITVAVAGVVAIVSGALALRILIVVDRGS